jgi:hypothetical protein
LLFAAGNLLFEGVAASFAGWRRPRTFMASKIKLPQAQEVPEKGLATPPDRPLLELSDAATKTLVRAAKKRGYITHDQINALSKEFNSEQIEDILAMFSRMGINVVESEEASDDEETDTATFSSGSRIAGTRIIAAPRQMARPGSAAIACSVSCAAAPGTMIPSNCAPPAATKSPSIPKTRALVFALEER